MLLGNYFKSAYRNLYSHKLFSLINILGLAIGLAAVMLITLFVRHELSFDKFWKNADQIYRVHMTFATPGQTPEKILSSTPPTVDAMARDYSEITHFTRFNTGVRTVNYKEDSFQERVTIADKGVVDMFDFDVIAGDIQTALDNNTGMVLNETLATKYFGTENPIGKVLTINMGDFVRDYQIKAVVKDLPNNSKVRIEMLALAVPEEWRFYKAWFGTSVHSYFMVKPDTNIKNIEDTLVSFVDRNFPPLPFGDGNMKVSEVVSVSIMNIQDLHLYAEGIGEWWVPQSSVEKVTIFALVAVLVLIIASINFMNLSTARASRRAKEVSLRKVMGANRKQLIAQFLGESILITLIALIIAIGLVEVSLPFYNEILLKELSINYASLDLLNIFALAFTVGILGGIYPAFILSGFRPAAMLSANQSSENSSSLKLRSFLVITQFTISIILFVSTFVIYSQTKFMDNIDIGYEPSNLVSVYGNHPALLEPKIDIIQRRFNNIDGVESVTWSVNFIPGTQGTGLDPIRTKKSGETNHKMVVYRGVGYDFLKTYNIPLITGRDYDRARNDERPTNEQLESGNGHTAGLILNESAVTSLGLGSPEEAIGEIIYMNVGQTGTSEGNTVLEAEFSVIGVVPDIHIQNLKEEATPEFYQLKTVTPFFVTMRIRGDQTRIMDEVKQIWLEEMPTNGFNIEYADEALAKQYTGERGQMTMFAAFSGLAIFIACLGLFGLASFTAERRTKEIGIRKVFGAEVFQIVRMLVFQFSKPVLIANVIAWPIAYLAMSRWLESFVYRIDDMVIIALCLLAGLTALLIAWATVAGNSYAVARQNPIKALRYE